MDPTQSPLNRAHLLSQKAEEYSSKELWDAALKAHQDAEEGFRRAAKGVENKTVAQTILQLAEKQAQHIKVVQRRIEKGKSKEQDVRKMLAGRKSADNDRQGQLTRRERPKESSGGGGGNAKALPRQAFPPSTFNTSPGSSQANFYPPSVANSVMMDSTISTTSTVIRNPIGESYAVLPVNPDPSDPFTQFYKRIEGMLTDISNPVAFAAAPLNGSFAEIPPSSPSSKPGKAASDAPASDELEGEPPEDLHGTESFYFVPSRSEDRTEGPPHDDRKPDENLDGLGRASTKTIEELLVENAALKSAVDTMTMALDRKTKQQAQRERENVRMRESIAQFSKEMRKEAGKVIAGRQVVHPVGEPAEVNDPASLTGAQRRIAELEIELKASREEAVRQASNASKYKSRLDELKAAIRKKKVAKAEAEANANATATGAGSEGTPPKRDSVSIDPSSAAPEG